jgi:hypothetical protein
MISQLLEPFDNEQRELVLRWRLWKQDWFPYRLADYQGYDATTGELKLGPWEWNRPRKWRRKHTGTLDERPTP